MSGLILHPHLDLPAWHEWRAHLMELDVLLRKALQQMENQAATTSARMSQAASIHSLFHRSMEQMLPAGIEFRDANQAMHNKYIEIDKAMKCLQPYHPLSLTFFEPTNHSERYRWLRDLALSFPVVLLKFTVGGAFGVLVWAMQRDADLVEIGDAEEIEAARALIQPVIPRVKCLMHS